MTDTIEIPQNAEQIDLYELDSLNPRVLFIKSGVHEIEKDVVLPEGIELYVLPATKLLFGTTSGIVVPKKSKLYLIGEKDKEIVFDALDHEKGWTNIYVLGGNLNARYCVFRNGKGREDKYSRYGYRGSGGALLIDRSSVLDKSAEINLEHVLIERCSAGVGGAICNYFGKLNVTDSRFIGNNAEWGGAIHNFYGDLTIIDSRFERNNAEWGGAICNDAYGELRVTNSSFIGNYSKLGGVIYNVKGTKVNPDIEQVNEFRENRPSMLTVI